MALTTVEKACNQEITQICIPKFAGPCAQGVLDTVIIPLSHVPGLCCFVCSIILFKDNAFLGTSGHESVPPVGYLLATRGFSFGVAAQNVLAKR